MKIYVDYFLLCDEVIIGKDDSVSLIKIYDIISAESLPALRGVLNFAVSLTITKPQEKDKSLKLKLSIKTPEGKEFLSANPIKQRELDTKSEVQKIGHIFVLQNVVFKGYGRYEAVLSVNEKILAHYFFIVEPIS